MEQWKVLGMRKLEEGGRMLESEDSNRTGRDRRYMMSRNEALRKRRNEGGKNPYSQMPWHILTHKL
jgi:hypothetical protein